MKAYYCKQCQMFYYNPKRQFGYDGGGLHYVKTLSFTVEDKICPHCEEAED